MDSPGKFISVLIVEDIDEMGELLRTLLEPIEGLKVSGVVQNVFQARIELTRRRPDLVLLDEILPGESSYDFMEELGKLEIAVILITGVLDQAQGRAIPSPALGRLEKPGWETLERDRARIKKYIFDRIPPTQA